MTSSVGSIENYWSDLRMHTLILDVVLPSTIAVTRQRLSRTTNAILPWPVATTSRSLRPAQTSTRYTTELTTQNHQERTSDTQSRSRKKHQRPAFALSAPPAFVPLPFSPVL